MTTCPPPYRPLRGADPPHFVDRADEEDIGTSAIVAGSVAAYSSGPCDPRFHRLVVSSGAMGKTAMLRAIGRETAARLDWAVTIHRCRPKERAAGAAVSETFRSMHRQWPAEVGRLAREMPPSGYRSPGYWPPVYWPSRCWPSRQGEQPKVSLTPDDRLAGGGFPAIDGLELVDGEASWATLRQFLTVAGQFARAISRGLLIMFDDADRLGGGEVESLGHLARSLSRDGLPVALLLSGGPNLMERFARLGNFLGCVWPSSLGWFDDSEAREALVVPAADRGVEFHEEALELLCVTADGSPLEIQRLGFAAWAAAPDPELVTIADVHAALAHLRPEAEARAS
jgi:hypothetical protein